MVDHNKEGEEKGGGASIKDDLGGGKVIPAIRQDLT